MSVNVTPSVILTTAFGEQPTGAVLTWTVPLMTVIGLVRVQVAAVHVLVRAPGKNAVSVPLGEELKGESPPTAALVAAVKTVESRVVVVVPPSLAVVPQINPPRIPAGPPAAICVGEAPEVETAVSV